MKITKEFLEKNKACSNGLEWVIENKLIGLDSIDFINKLIESEKLEWANWLIVLCMEYKQYVSYAIYAAEQVIDIFEKKYPNDKRPRQAIETAKKCLENPSEENKNIAAAAAAHASASAPASYYRAAYSAAYAAYSAALAAYYAAYSAASDASASDAASTLINILNYGLELLKK